MALYNVNRDMEVSVDQIFSIFVPEHIEAQGHVAVEQYIRVNAPGWEQDASIERDTLTFEKEN